MNHSENINEIAGALAKAQSEMQNAVFDSENPHFKSKFASLAALRDAVVPSLAKHGISILQDLENVEGGISCTTYLLHSSGQKLVFGPLIIPYTKSDAWGMGSAATYAKRYQMAAISCVVGDSDDDAVGATGKGIQKAYDAPHSPAGDAAAHVDSDLAQAAAKRMTTILETDVDEDRKAMLVAGESDVLNKNQSLYIAAAGLLPAPKRNAWKAYVSQAKKLAAAEPARGRF